MKLYTIGYEGEPQAAVIDRLKAGGVTVLADVRAVAASRRAGFSRTVPGLSLAEAGIEYVHLRDLGAPGAGRDAARNGRIGAMREIFAGHMAEPASRLAFERLREIAKDRPTAPLCFEADHAGCHRAVLAAEDGFEVVNL